MTKQNELTIRQQWARGYRADIKNYASSFGEFSLEADAYAKASWEACKARILDILAAHEEYIDGYDKTYIHVDALEEIKDL